MNVGGSDTESASDPEVAQFYRPGELLTQRFTDSLSISSVFVQEITHRSPCLLNMSIVHESVPSMLPVLSLLIPPLNRYINHAVLSVYFTQSLSVF